MNLATIALVAALSTMGDYQALVSSFAKFDADNRLVMPTRTLRWAYVADGEPASVRGLMPAIIARAAAEWSAVCPVRFTSSDRFVNVDAHSIVGWVEPDSLPQPNWAQAEVYINVDFMPADLFIERVAIKLDPARITSAESAFYLVRHELGHAIGLQHTDAFESVMSGPPYTPYAWPAGLTRDDVDACRSLYHNGAKQ